MVLLSIIPALFILPMIILAIIFLVVAKYEENIEREISKRCYEFKSKIESGNIHCEILKQQDIVRLCNLINNSSYTNIEDSEVEATIPISSSGYNDGTGYYFGRDSSAWLIILDTWKRGNDRTN